MGVFIKGIGNYLPGLPIPNSVIEKRITVGGKPMVAGLIKKTMGSEFRYHAAAEEQVSDLAAKAARPLLETYQQPIDLLIFASASADLIEPATCNIVQQKLGLSCPAFDVKNACNSVLTAIEIGSSLLETTGKKNILIVSGEKPSDSILYRINEFENVKKHFASFSFGDAGVALILEKTEEDRGIFFQKSKTVGQHWPLCTIKGGGSMFPNDATKLRFTGFTYQLRDVFKELMLPFTQECLDEANLKMKDIDHLCTHQVSAGLYEDISAHFNLPLNRFVPLFKEYGNTASTAVPLAYHHLVTQKGVKSGDLVMLLGLAAGVNISVQFIRM